ncbi:MAG: TonB-dependent siderophore receptor [Oceanipulchritudo sp.]
MHTRNAFSLGGLLIFGAVVLHGQTDGNEQADMEVFELSPFEVSTSGDKGYYASNTISGSRISVPIQEIPLTIEVVTSEFIEDTGATDLRDSLRYSAGVLLQSQNDAYGSIGDIGNVNNPEGVTGDKGDSSFKIRGFTLQNTLRNGFRRQHATDTVNIDRIEVIRGPSALLYGVGNFGGVVNYLTKTPLPEFQQQVNVSYGSDNFKRASIDSTGPIIEDHLGYRLTMAYEDSDDWTDLNTREHVFISPVIQWKFWDRIKLTLDYEYGKADEDAISFKSVRTPSIEGINITQADRLLTFGFLEFSEDKNANQILDEGEDLNGNGRIDLTRDPRTFRWSGPDTFLDTESWNTSVSMEVRLADNMYYQGGINVSNVKFNFRDVFGGLSANATPRAVAILDEMEAAGRGFLARQIIDGSSSDTLVPVYDKVFQYNWNGAREETDWLQHRHELTFSRRIAEGNKWLESEHNFLLGYSMENQKYERTDLGNTDSPDEENYYFKDPTDESYLRFGPAEDGFEIPFKANNLSGNTSSNVGKYIVYSGRYLNDRLFLVAGMREDKTTNEDGYSKAILEEGFGRPTIFPDTTVRKRTNQYGVSFEVIDGFSVFALKSEGVEPNFDGQRDGLGNALESTVADAEEFGIKFNVLDGRIAGTISKFKIRREGLPFSYWWAPAPIRGNFRPEDDIVYRLDEWNTGIKGVGSPDPDSPDYNPDYNRYHAAALDEWNAAIAAGVDAIYQLDEGGPYYVNASTPQGAAYLDAVFNALKEAFEVPFDEPGKDLDPWPGFLYGGFDDDEVNTAAEDLSGTTEGSYFQTISDESNGWEAQIILSPLDNLQVILNYSHVEREVLDPGQFVEYPYAEGNWDRWAMWYFPNNNWGLAGVPAELVYPGGEGEGMPSKDTSTWTGIGWGKGESLDDTPEDVVSWWIHYTFLEDTRLSGLEIGFGGQWESKREFASAFTTAGQKKQNETGTTIKAFTDDRLTLNAMAKYSWKVRDKYDAFIQVNVDNFLDDKDQYGFFYAPGMSWKINMGVTF